MFINQSPSFGLGLTEFISLKNQFLYSVLQPSPSKGLEANSLG